MFAHILDTFRQFSGDAKKPRQVTGVAGIFSVNDGLKLLSQPEKLSETVSERDLSGESGVVITGYGRTSHW